MMKVIHKYPIETDDRFINPQGLARSEQQVPKSLRVLKVETQKSRPMLWGISDAGDEEKRVLRTWIAVTGDPVDLPPEAVYLGTCTGVAGFLVMHIFMEQLQS